MAGFTGHPIKSLLGTTDNSPLFQRRYAATITFKARLERQKNVVAVRKNSPTGFRALPPLNCSSRREEALTLQFELKMEPPHVGCHEVHGEDVPSQPGLGILLRHEFQRASAGQ